MAFKLHFLGTGCMIPTKNRNHLSVALEYEGEILLFDCGEGTQLQIRKIKLPLGKIKKIFISHWHGDHTLGLGGLIQTISNTQGVEKIEIHGPINTKSFIDNILKSSIFDCRIKINVFEHSPKEDEILKILENNDYEINVCKLNHSVPCIAYSFKEKNKLNIDKIKAKKLNLENSPLLARIKLGLPINFNNKKIVPKDLTYEKIGKKISFVFDTRPCPQINKLVENSDYLVMEATFIYKTHHQKAEEFDHMSAKETGQIARESGVKNLIITHFSQRYKDTKDIEIEAKEEFENTTSTEDLMTLKIN